MRNAGAIEQLGFDGNMIPIHAATEQRAGTDDGNLFNGYRLPG
jgi:hypothetical protein